MSFDPENAPGSTGEAGEPVRVLRDLEQETSAEFVLKVRRKIQRRNAASNVVSLSWHLPKMILAEMAGILHHLFTAMGGRKDSQP